MFSEHGGDAFGLDILYDFSANLNPLGMPESAKKALNNSVMEWEKYPDPSCRKLTQKLAAAMNLQPEQIVCGNGAADLIYRIISTIKPRKCVLCSPTFSEYEKALRENNCEIEYFPLLEENDFRLDERISETLTNGTEMLILCNPNNPAGGVISRELLKKICEKCAQKNITFLCDECFLEFTENAENNSALNFLNEKTIVLKAFTKIFAMAGIRLGYAVFGDCETAWKTAQSGQCWSVSAPAQIAGTAVLDDEIGTKIYLKKTRELIKTERELLKKSLNDLGIRTFDSSANFLLLKSDLRLFDALLEERILLRNCANFRGLDERFFRIAVRTHEENQALVEALRRVIGG